jgi:hypothetical protein
MELFSVSLAQILGWVFQRISDTSSMLPVGSLSCLQFRTTYHFSMPLINQEPWWLPAAAPPEWGIDIVGTHFHIRYLLQPLWHHHFDICEVTDLDGTAGRFLIDIFGNSLCPTKIYLVLYHFLSRVTRDHRPSTSATVQNLGTLCIKKF